MPSIYFKRRFITFFKHHLIQPYDFKLKRKREINYKVKLSICVRFLIKLKRKREINYKVKLSTCVRFLIQLK